jgi:hypothetical protein
MARAEHDSEDDCKGGDDYDAGGQGGSRCALPVGARGAWVAAITRVVRRDVHGATLGGVANRALTVA